VAQDAQGDYVFLGRRDRMVKKRGYRIELGEIETCLYEHPDIEEVGVIATSDVDGNVRLKAYLSSRGGQRLSVVALKAFCAGRVPNYMIPDQFIFMDKLPRTSTDKVDYQNLSASSA
jgi:acyl-coenzyme A synthetase/AMP-(fatty) acid ligase